MKLSRVEEQGVDILTVSGPVADHDVQVLGAGVGKLILAGHANVVMELQDAKLPDSLFVELANLDQVARAQSGRLVLVSASAEVRAKAGKHGAPTPLESFADRASALSLFSSSRSAAAAAPSAAAPAAEDSGDAASLSKGEIRKREVSELGKLRETISRLENENKVLTEQLQTLLVGRRSAPDDRGYQQRIDDLEARLEELMNEAGGGRRR